MCAYLYQVRALQGFVVTHERLKRNSSSTTLWTGRAIGDDSHAAFRATDKETGVKELPRLKRSNFTTVEQSGRRNVSARDVPTRFVVIHNGPRMDLTCSQDGPPLG